MLQVALVRQIHTQLKLDVSFSLRSECGVLFGHSGAGKTSLLHLIAGFLTPESGQIVLGDRPLFDSTRRLDVVLRLRRIGYMDQQDLLFPHLDTRRNVGFGLRGWSASEARARIGEVAALCGIEKLLTRYPETLSGGERQRVGLARALAPRPALLLCDEPVSALDIPARFELLDRLRGIQRSEQIPILLVTHSPAEAIAVGDRLFLLDQGTIRAEGLPLEVLTAARLGSHAWREPARNVVRSVVEQQKPDLGETIVRLQGAGSPRLTIPFHRAAEGDCLRVVVRSDEILLGIGGAAGLAGSLSARNILPGRVEKIFSHDGEAEVLVQTGAVFWTVSVVAAAISSLRLSSGSEVQLIIKARSCQVLDAALLD